jgi:hypothetical protein
MTSSVSWVWVGFFLSADASDETVATRSSAEPQYGPPKYHRTKAASQPRGLRPLMSGTRYLLFYKTTNVR